SATYTTMKTMIFCNFLFNATPSPAFYTLSLHDALPIYFFATSAKLAPPRNATTSDSASSNARALATESGFGTMTTWRNEMAAGRSEEHTSELQSRENLVCRLLLEKKKKNINARRTRQDV